MTQHRFQHSMWIDQKCSGNLNHSARGQDHGFHNAIAKWQIQFIS